jgi:ubiquinone/menaquinone biosynthesis C-methylase UbiE
MPDRFNPRHRKNLLKPERRRRLPLSKILPLIDLRPRHTVLDIGAGVGYFAIPMLKLLNSRGRLFAIDISPVMLDDFKLRLPRYQARVQTVVADAQKIPLPDGIADRILMALVLHEIENPVQALQETRRLLKKNGKLLIIEWHRQPPPPGPDLTERFDPADLFRLVREAGFAIADHDDINRFHYYTLLKPVENFPRTVIIK